MDQVAQMARFKKGVMLAVLMMLFITGALLSLPHASSQAPTVEIVDIGYVKPPDTIAVGEATTVTVTVRYTNLLPNTKVAAQIQDLTTYDLIAGTGYVPLSGSGRHTFSMVITPTRPGDWHLSCQTWLLGQPFTYQEITIAVTVQRVFDFSVKVDPDHGSLRPGESTSCTVNVGLIGGSAEAVSLMYTIPPVAGISASLSTAKGTSPFTSVLKISTTAQTPPGTYTINVVGVAGSLQRTATFTLSVTTAVYSRRLGVHDTAHLGRSNTNSACDHS